MSQHPAGRTRAGGRRGDFLGVLPLHPPSWCPRASANACCRRRSLRWEALGKETLARGKQRVSAGRAAQPTRIHRPTGHKWGITDPPATEGSRGNGPPTSHPLPRLFAGCNRGRHSSVPGTGRHSPLLSASPSRKPTREQVTISGSTRGHGEHHPAPQSEGRKVGGCCVTPLRRDGAPHGPPTASSRGGRGTGIPRQPGGGGEQGGPAEESGVSRGGDTHRSGGRAAGRPARGPDRRPGGWGSSRSCEALSRNLF